MFLIIFPNFAIICVFSVPQSESPATAFASAGIVLADDGMPIIGGYAFGNQFNLSGDNWVVSWRGCKGWGWDASIPARLANIFIQ